MANTSGTAKIVLWIVSLLKFVSVSWQPRRKHCASGTSCDQSWGAAGSCESTAGSCESTGALSKNRTIRQFSNLSHSGLLLLKDVPPAKIG